MTYAVGRGARVCLYSPRGATWALGSNRLEGRHGCNPKSPSLVLVINDTKLLMLLYQVKWARHKQHVMEVEMAWRDGHKTTRFGAWNDEKDHEEMHIKWWTWWSSGGEGSKSARQKYNHRVFSFAGLRWVEKWLTGFRIHSRLSRGAITVSSGIKCH
jgi:hypothetical protein